MSGAPIDPERYTSPAFAERERQGLWPKVWLVAGHASELAGEGSQVTIEIGADSFLVTRGDDGKARAFVNACLHRGTLLCDRRRARATELRCPYHGFRYDLGGALIAAPGRDDLVDEGARLTEIGCEERAGLVWIRAASEGPTLEAFLGPLAPHLEKLGLGELGLVADHAYPLACNWKLSADVHNEALHLPVLHPDLAKVIDLTTVRWEALGLHARYLIPVAGHGEKEQLYVFPNVQLNVSGDTLELYRHRPGADALASTFDEQRFERGAKLAEVRHEALDPARADPKTAMGQDLLIMPRVQRGMRSRGFAGLRVGAGEEAIAHMHRGIDAFLAGRT